jgi:16S rRNA (cytidine1402-2'-O)-methyltransferase
MPCGQLWLIPTPLGENSDPHRVLPADTLAVIEALDYFVVENARTARAFLKAVGTRTPLQALTLRELSEHTPPEAIPALLAPILEGRDAGVLSEAGAPGVADPGAALVAAAHAAGVVVRPLIGPSALLLALMASGLNGQRFAFAGYVPVAAPARLQRLRELERRSADEDETVLIIETPYRNQALFDAALQALSPTTRLLVASDLSLQGEHIRTDTVDAWRRRAPTVPRTPTVFGLQATRRVPAAARAKETSRTNETSRASTASRRQRR